MNEKKKMKKKKKFVIYYNMIYIQNKTDKRDSRERGEGWMDIK